MKAGFLIGPILPFGLPVLGTLSQTRLESLSVHLVALFGVPDVETGDEAIRAPYVAGMVPVEAHGDWHCPLGWRGMTDTFLRRQ